MLDRRYDPLLSGSRVISFYRAGQYPTVLLSLELIISTLTEDSIKVLYRISETELVIQSRTTWKTYASRRHGSPTSADDSATGAVPNLTLNT